MPRLASAAPTAAEVDQVRSFNRFYTNVIGLLHGVYLDTSYTLTEGRLLFEIAQRDVAAVSWLRQALDIDAGYLSRVLSRFEAEGLLTRHRSEADGRRQDIAITAAGRAAVADLDERAERQVTQLLAGANVARLLEAMRVIAEELGEPGAGEAAPAPRVVLLRPLKLGDLGWVLQRHASVYAAEFGWNADFEAVCATIIAEYVAFRASAPAGTAGWVAEVDGKPAGCVFCVPDAPGDEATARLRLLLVEPWARRFAREAGYGDIVLWTYDRLAAARRVYQAAGFTLASEHEDNAFGHRMKSQTWARPL